MRALPIVLGLSLLALPAVAQECPTLAMHTIASYEYLYCEELTVPPYGPMDCTMIDNSATTAELDASYGYVYVVLLAYNDMAGGITGVEFALCGWPALRGAPPTPLLQFCPTTTLVLGDPWTGGGIAAFGQTVFPLVDCGGVVCFAWFIWGAYAYPTYLPITLSYQASAYSYPGDPHNYVLGPPPDFLECIVDPGGGVNLGPSCYDCGNPPHPADPMYAWGFGCTIGGTYGCPVPYYNCHPDITAADETTWSGVKAMYK